MQHRQDESEIKKALELAEEEGLNAVKHFDFLATTAGNPDAKQ